MQVNTSRTPPAHNHLPTVQQTADYYRERNGSAASSFPVDAERETGFRALLQRGLWLRLAAENGDIMIPFASIDPAKGKAGAREARRLVREFGVRGFKFHPTMQGFYPNDRAAYPPLRGDRGRRAPSPSSTPARPGSAPGCAAAWGCASSTPTRCMSTTSPSTSPTCRIILAHPSFPWTEEALSVATHKPNVYIDMSGWSPRYFPPVFVQYANTILRKKMLFGSDWPALTPDRWLSRLRPHRHPRGRAPAAPQGERPRAPRRVRLRTGPPAEQGTRGVDSLGRTPYSAASPPAQVAELVDAHGSGPCAARREGSSPFLGTTPCPSAAGLPAFRSAARSCGPVCYTRVPRVDAAAADALADEAGPDRRCSSSGDASPAMCCRSLLVRQAVAPNMRHLGRDERGTSRSPTARLGAASLRRTFTLLIPVAATRDLRPGVARTRNPFCDRGSRCARIQIASSSAAISRSTSAGVL